MHIPKNVDIIDDFIGKSYNNNGNPWKLVRILRVILKTLEIFGDFFFF